MPNYSKATLARIGRLMSAGEAGDPPALVALAKSGAFGRKAIYNWSLPETDPQHRKMPRIAKRMVAMLAYFSAAGLLNARRLEDIVALEALFEDEKDSAVILRRFKRVIAANTKPAAGKAAPQEAAAAEADDDADDLDDDGGHAGGAHRDGGEGAQHHPG